MRRSLLLLTLWVGMPAAAAPKLKVVATLSDFAAIAREIGGDQVDVQSLAKSTQDPHYVDGKPSLVLGLARADLLILNGVDLEAGWLSPLMVNSRNEKIQRGNPGYLDCSTLVTLKDVPTQKLDRSMGDIHPGGNPHYMKDPRNGLLVAKGIAERLAQISPERAELFRAAAGRFEQRTQEKLAAWSKALEPFKGTPVVTYHKSWIYFVEWAGLVEVAFVEPKPGVPPSAGHVANVVSVIRARKVPLILQETWYSASTSELMARNTAAILVRVPGMTGEEQSYLDYVDVQVNEVVKALAAKRGKAN